MNIFLTAAATCQTKPAGSGLVDAGNLPMTCANGSTLTKIFTEVFIVLGALAFLMLVVAGFRFVLAAGEPEKVAESRRQILYAFIGLIVAASAAAIVNFVLGA